MTRLYLTCICISQIFCLAYLWYYVFAKSVFRLLGIRRSYDLFTLPFELRRDMRGLDYVRVSLVYLNFTKRRVSRFIKYLDY